MPVQLKNLVSSYPPRLEKFLENIVKVRALKPRDHHLWRVMDSVAFQDTETALEVALYNERVLTESRKKA